MTMNELLSVLVSKTKDETGDSILDLIYDNYAESHGWGDAQSKEYYDSLCALVQNHAPADQEAIMELVNILCDAHEHTAFMDGVKLGVRLLCELMV